jgi:hypothetical protein
MSSNQGKTNIIRFRYAESNRILIDTFNCLIEKYDSIKTFEVKKVGIYYLLKKLVPCFTVLDDVSKSNSVQSIITLERMILDNYTVLFFLTNFESKKNQDLRYYLFLLDAVETRYKIIDEFLINNPTAFPEFVIDQKNNTVLEDKKTRAHLLQIIKTQNLDAIVNKEIIIKSNWKFKDPNSVNKKYNSYKWQELYEIAKIPKRHAIMLQDYNSSYVHGLGLSLMIDDDFGAYLKVMKSLDFGSIIQSMIVKIILGEFPTETKKISLPNNYIKFMNENWSNWK